VIKQNFRITFLLETENDDFIIELEKIIHTKIIIFDSNTPESDYNRFLSSINESFNKFRKELLP